uniref:FeS_assembly_P domain-containing protein n=1 Tax=Trichuris muris TaxID=70415 RepID=A0A5S6QUI0_TRIMR
MNVVCAIHFKTSIILSSHFGALLLAWSSARIYSTNKHTQVQLRITVFVDDLFTVSSSIVRLALQNMDSFSLVNDRQPENAAPAVFAKVKKRQPTASELDPDVSDPFDAREIFDLIRSINDPEHPLTLEELNVVSEANVHVNDQQGSVLVYFTPTIPHCSMAMLIGLCIRAKLARTLPSRFKYDVLVSPGSHVQEQQITKQLADKERVAAALERSNILDLVNQCLRSKD